MLHLADSIIIAGRHRFVHRRAATGEIMRERTYQNIICVNGKTAIVLFLQYYFNPLGGGLPPGSAYGAVGTGTGVFDGAETQLYTELASNGRVLIASCEQTANVWTSDYFFTQAQAIGTLTEFGLFLFASATINNGYLLSHVKITETKTTDETLTVESVITVGA